MSAPIIDFTAALARRQAEAWTMRALLIEAADRFDAKRDADERLARWRDQTGPDGGDAA
jgi:hypothetical protein